MKVVKYLNDLTSKQGLSAALIALKNEYGVNSKVYDTSSGSLILLDYDQLDTGTLGNVYSEIVMECRSLVLYHDKDGDIGVASRSFSRFFNYNNSLSGNEPLKNFQLKTDKNGHFTKPTYVMPKIDGSLIALYKNRFDGKWYFRTRAMLFAEGKKNTFYVDGDLMILDNNCKTIAKHLLDTVGLNSIDELTDVLKSVSGDHTFIFEWASPLNLHITPQDRNRLVLIGVSHNASCTLNVYSHPTILKFCSDFLTNAGLSNIEPVESKEVYSIQEVDKILSELQGVEEGLVVYQTNVDYNDYMNIVITHSDTDESIRVKMKTLAYMQAFRLRSEGFNTISIIEVVAEFNEKHIGGVFARTPKLIDTLEEYAAIRDSMLIDAQTLYDENSTIEDQKEFSLAIKHCALKDIIFAARKKRISVIDAWKQAKLPFKTRLLQQRINFD